MSANSKLCPNREELVDYLLGKTSEDSLENLETHLRQCQTCDETIREINLKDDTLAGWIRQSSPDSDHLQENDTAFVANLIQRIQLNPTMSRTIDPMVADRAAEVLRLVQNDNEDGLGVLAHYRLDKVVGAGSTGVVFKATDLELNRSVALKILRPSLGDAARNRFISEAQAAASIDHPNVVMIYQVGDASGLAFIAMQWLPGESLEDRLNRVTFVPEDAMTTMAQQIAAGLGAAHDKNLIHRDIKPANIWLAENNDEIKILDFGLARIPDDDPDLTSTGMLAGTPNFMSPEQAKGMELDGRSDLFSVGCTMYRATTGKLPFGAASILATLQAIQNHTPNPPCQLNPAISDDFSDLIMCCLEKQTVNRPANANDLQRALGNPRPNWPFLAGRHHGQSKPTLATATKPKPWLPRWVAAASIITLSFFAWNVFGQQIVRIVSDEGELVIESTDENVEIQLLANGKVVRVIDGLTDSSFNIKSGEYELAASSGSPTGPESNSFIVEPQKLIMNRGGKQIVTVTRNPISTNPTTAAATVYETLSTVDGAEPMYGGLTFDQWYRRLQNERSMDAFSDGLVALGTLAAENPDNLAKALDLVTKLMRKHGSSVITSEHRWTNVFNAFFSELQPKDVVDFAVKELPVGSTQSRSQLIWHVILGGIYKDNYSDPLCLTAEVERRLPEIINVALATLESDRQSHSTVLPLINGALSGASSNNSQGTLSGFSKTNAQFLCNRLNNLTNLDTKALFAKALANRQLECGITAVGELITDTELSPKRRQELFQFAIEMSHEKYNILAPGLLELARHDDLIDELIPVYNNRYTSRVSPNLSTQKTEFKIWLVSTIARRGKHVLSALPDFEKLAEDEPALRFAVARAIKRIRQSVAIFEQILGGEASLGGRGGGRGMAGLGDADKGYNDAELLRNNRFNNDDSIRKESDGTAVDRGGSKFEAVNTATPPRVPNEIETTIRGGEVSSPVYNGKNLNQWLTVLVSETNPQLLAESLTAIPYLIQGNKADQQLAIRDFKEFTRLGKAQGPIPHKHFRRFFYVLSEQDFLRLMKQQLVFKENNTRKAWLSLIQCIPENKNQIIADNLDNIILDMFDNIVDNMSLKTATTLISSSDLFKVEGNSENPESAPSKVIIERFESIAPESTDKETGFLAASSIIKNGGKSKILSNYIVQYLTGNDFENHVASTYKDVLQQVSMVEQPRLVDVLKNIYTSDIAKAKINEAFWNASRTPEFCKKMFGTGETIIGEKPHLAEFIIVRDIANRGADGKPALDWLEELVKAEFDDFYLSTFHRKPGQMAEQRHGFKAFLNDAIERLKKY